MLSQIAEQIHRVMIEDEINSLNLSEMGNTIMQEMIEVRKAKSKSEKEKKLLEDKEKDMLNDKLSELVYADLFEQLLVKIKFDDIPNKMIEKVSNFRSSMTINTSILKTVTVDPIDYAVDEFTPGEHSPTHYEIDEKLNEEPIPIAPSPVKNEDVTYEFADTDEFNDIEDLE